MIHPIPPAFIAMMDVPPLHDSDSHNPGFYVAACPTFASPSWRGVLLQRSLDDGKTFTQSEVIARATTMGHASTALAANGDSVRVRLVSPDHLPQALLSMPAKAIQQGANAAVLGTEVLKFTNAVIVDKHTYELSGLIRGHRGTAPVDHAAGELFVFRSANWLRVPLNADELGKPFEYKAQSVHSTQAIKRTFTCNASWWKGKP